MKRFVTLAVLIMLFVSAFSVTGVAAQRPSQEWIVISAAEGVMKLPTFANSQVQIAGGRIVRQFPQIGALVVSSTDANFARKMSALGLLAAPNRIIPNENPTRLVRQAVNPSASDGSSNPLAIYQWSLKAVHAQEGWAAGRRGQGATVAVLDEGFYLNHPDLAANFDLRNAASFVPGESVQWTAGVGFSHGTHVSGIIAAVDNTIGNVGVAPQAKVIPVKVLSEQLGYGEDAWVISGMLYVGQLRATGRSNVSIINMSLGGLCERTDPECRAVKRVYDLVVTLLKLQGITTVISAGNDELNADANRNIIVLPAQARNALSISATGPIGWGLDPSADPRRPASYSNFGKTLVTYAAPGGDFAYPGEEPCTVGGVARPCWVYDMVQSPGEASSDGVYSYWAAGTSMAAPHVAGILAQYASAVGGTITPAQAEQALKHFAQRLSPIAFYGNGFTRAN
ncbi:MAG: S8 family serine peptidase [Chloroflexi bacterium]|nr:S8 family serine peptidase [Chloroflexota bacterium]MCC6894921.1 S8 family serine peptidase [Anaerolineae bacterium]